VGHSDEEQIANRPDGLPTLLPILNSVEHRNMKRIEEYSAGPLRAHAVLAPVGEVLRLIPLEAYALHTKIVIINL